MSYEVAAFSFEMMMFFQYHIRILDIHLISFTFVQLKNLRDVSCVYLYRFGCPCTARSGGMRFHLGHIGDGPSHSNQ